jgi:ubiquinone/menaquinone biosynthesis C-methylase UbiE
MNQPLLPDDISEYYNAGREESRLERPAGVLERLRTQELILRSVPQLPATIIDVGGGTGPYAFWLAELGYTVHLVDAMPLHIEQARERAKGLRSGPTSIELGDARRLVFADHSAEVVLLLGPLYHLTERGERLATWREAWRVAKPGGLILAAAISRYASLLDGLSHSFLDDPVFEQIVRQDLASGQHRNPLKRSPFFTTAYFHTVEELREEALEAGWQEVEVLAVEGPAWLTPASLDRLQQPGPLQGRYLAMIRLVEHDPALLAVSSHLLVIAHKAGEPSPNAAGGEGS